MPYIEVTQWIKGPLDEVYRLASDMEKYPEFMQDVRSVKVIERGEGYTVTDWVTEVDGRTIRWRERDEFFPENGKIAYRQLTGDLKKFEGEWRFADEKQGCRVALTVDFDLGIPMLAPILNPILKKKVQENSQAMLDAIKQKVEARNRMV